MHDRDPNKFQHQGYGTLLMEEAERIAWFEHGSEKLVVIAGVGTRHYYRKLGYELDGPYMSKWLRGGGGKGGGGGGRGMEEEWRDEQEGLML